MAKPILLLDVMDTLVRDPAFDVVPAFFGGDLQTHYATKSKTAFHAFERGEIDEPTFRARYFNDGREWDLEGLKSRLQANFCWIPGVRALVRELVEEGFQLHAMSNYSQWYDLVEAACGISDAGVRRSFVSCDTGVRKPDPRAYLGACEALGVAPSACLFVDDRIKNVTGAHRVGMPAVQFRDAASLRQVLSRNRPRT